MIRGVRKLCPGHSRAGGDPRGGFREVLLHPKYPYLATVGKPQSVY